MRSNLQPADVPESDLRCTDTPVHSMASLATTKHLQQKLAQSHSLPQALLILMLLLDAANCREGKPTMQACGGACLWQQGSAGPKAVRHSLLCCCRLACGRLWPVTMCFKHIKIVVTGCNKLQHTAVAEHRPIATLKVCHAAGYLTIRSQQAWPGRRRMDPDFSEIWNKTRSTFASQSGRQSHAPCLGLPDSFSLPGYG